MKATAEFADLLDAHFCHMASREPGDRVWRELVEFLHFWARLVIDIVRHWNSAESSESEMRAFYRATFAALDAFLSFAANLYLFLNESGFIHLSPLEVLVLQEKKIHLDSVGEPTTVDNFLPFSHKLRYLLNLAARRSIPGFKVDVSDSGWQSLRDAISKRHRLMHPKQFEDLLIDREDVQHLKNGLGWLYKQCLFVLFLNGFCGVVRKIDDDCPIATSTDEELLCYLNIDSSDFDEASSEIMELRKFAARGTPGLDEFCVIESSRVSEHALNLLQEGNFDQHVRECGALLRKKITKDKWEQLSKVMRTGVVM